MFETHTQDYPVVTDAIDFSHFFDLAEQSRDREQCLVVETVYRALFEGIDENADRVNVAYDHYAKALQPALDGEVECILAADASDEDCDRYVSVVKRRISEYGVNSKASERAFDELDDRCGKEGSQSASKSED